MLDHFSLPEHSSASCIFRLLRRLLSRQPSFNNFGRQIMGRRPNVPNHLPSVHLIVIGQGVF
jgi:hypothetical protein